MQGSSLRGDGFEQYRDVVHDAAVDWGWPLDDIVFSVADSRVMRHLSWLDDNSSDNRVRN